MKDRQCQSTTAAEHSLAHLTETQHSVLCTSWLLRGEDTVRYAMKTKEIPVPDLQNDPLLSSRWYQVGKG
jgi:hypothetical protein